MPTPPPFPPRCAARFRPERLLGQGGYGAVYRAFDGTLGRPCVVKLLHLGLEAGDEAVRRFTNEARITARLHHPAIVAVIDHDVEDGVPWIAYELLEGRDLRAALAADALPLAGALAATLAVCGALDEAHRHGILHRDLKPENVMMLAAGGFKLMDFGIAKWSGHTTVQTEAGTVIGTPAYLAPELWRGQPASPASDLYALGVMLHELSTGMLPFDGVLSAIISGHLNGDPPRASEARPGLPKALDGLLAKLLAKTPGDRPASAAAVAAELEALAARGPTRTVASRPPAGRVPLALAAAALVAVALALGAVLVLRPRPVVPMPPPPPASHSGAPARPAHRDPLELLFPTCADAGDEKYCLKLIRSTDRRSQIRGKLGLAALAARQPALDDDEHALARAALDYVKKQMTTPGERECEQRTRAYLGLKTRRALVESLEIYRELRRSDRNDDRALVGVALTGARLRQTDAELLPVYAGALVLHADSFELHEALAYALLAARSLDAAEREVQAMRRLRPSSLLTRIHENRLLLYRGRVDEARALAGALAREGTQQPAEVLALCWHLMEVGLVREMADVAKAALARNPSNEQLFEVLAHARLRQERFRDVVEEANRFLERNKGSLVIYPLRARGWMMLEDFEKARIDLEHAILSFPVGHRPYAQKLELLNRQARYGEAIDVARTVPDAEQSADVARQAGVAHHHRGLEGDGDRAIELFTRALAMRPDDAATLCDRAEALLKLRRFDDAARDAALAEQAAPMADFPSVTRARVREARAAARQ